MRTLALLSVLVLAACSGAPGDYKSYLEGRKVGLSTSENIRHCHAYGCQRIANVEFMQKDWREVKAVFSPAPTTAEKERERIAKSIAIFEKKIGARAGTDTDERGTFRHTGDDQLDCVDESTNTTTYLSLLQNQNLLKFHRVVGPTMRFPIIHAGRWPHQTAVIEETPTGKLYAVDSWFRDNGHPADIISLKEWKEGWKPRDVRDLL